MRNRNGYRSGGFWRIDDRTGFRVRADRTAKEWDGTIVAREDFEERHPQDFVRGRRDEMRVPDPRPEPDDITQAAPGGPFILIEHDGDGTVSIAIADGDIRIYGSGPAQITASDL